MAEKQDTFSAMADELDEIKSLYSKKMQGHEKAVLNVVRRMATLCSDAAGEDDENHGEQSIEVGAVLAGQLLSYLQKRGQEGDVAAAGLFVYLFAQIKGIPVKRAETIVLDEKIFAPIERVKVPVARLHHEQNSQLVMQDGVPHARAEDGELVPLSELMEVAKNLEKVPEEQTVEASEEPEAKVKSTDTSEG